MCMSKPKAAKPAEATSPVVSVTGSPQNGAVDRSRQRGLAASWTRYDNPQTAPATTTTEKSDKLGG
jgi:hypothetical protein